MKFNILRLFNKGEKPEPIKNRLSEFLLYASEQEKAEVFTEAARRANEDQKKVFDEANLKLNTR